MIRQSIVGLLAAILLLWGLEPAQAGAISFSFSGVVTGSYVYTGSPSGGNINGDLVTGRVTAATDNCTGAFGFCAGPVSITFNVAGQHIVYGNGLDFGSILVANTPGGQTVTLEPAFDPYFNADFFLTGGPNAFIRGTQYNTLHLGPVGMASAEFMDGRGLQAGIEVTSIDGVPVAEPGSLLLLLTGLAGAGACLARLRRRPAQAAGGCAMCVASTAPLSASTSRRVTS